MHAVALQATFNDPSVAMAQLDGIVSQVSGMPGFATGYWVALSGDRGRALIVFDAEGDAQSFADGVRSHPADGVATESIEVGDVVAHAWQNLIRIGRREVSPRAC